MLVFWVHFVLAQAMCVSCALFCIKYYRKKKKEQEAVRHSVQQ